MPWIRATYRIRSTPEQIEARALALAVEQSLETPPSAVPEAWILEEVLASVEAIWEEGRGNYRVVLRMNAENSGFEVAGLLNALFGNCSLQEDVELLEAELPPELIEVFPGPRLGILGLRRLTGVYGRPLTCTALKPQGLSPNQLAALAHTFALGGIDIVKDDHNLGQQRYAPFAARVPLIQRAIQRANAETGRNTLYAPMLLGGPKGLAQSLRIVREEGVQVVMVAPMVLGLPAFYELAQELEVALLAHPAFAGTRMAPPLLLGRFFRLLGADACIFPHYGGRFAYSEATCAQIAQNLTQPWGVLQPTLPVPAGGMRVERTEEIVRFYGPDCMLLIGGDLLSTGDVLERTRAFVRKVACCGVE
ncbi:MAG: RuBisCO large subunit C-terminal-like domain-containing protein [Meiothermus sp.]|uniref:RuBisCO large subunit C-terminal-like domain-containing protein n=1 Tax=Meiothermus sp. TaxID=1955249 RepID=UPI00298F33F9|nr:RuBisCO large subunit C-terminal-like domain-containing protein [Meiothermus sp.]MDW8481896.1 RuBisCO large subunit C-terminal-like domain-containing protein [Meiothermus sp.]